MADKSEIDFIRTPSATFAAGLHWDAVEDSRGLDRERRAKTRASGQRGVLTWQVSKSKRGARSGNGQFAFGPSSVDGQPVYSLAAFIALALGEGTLGAFQCSDGKVALVAIGQGATVLVDLVGDPQAIRERWDQELSEAESFNRVFGRKVTDLPAGFAEAETIALSAHASERKKDLKAVRLEGSRGSKLRGSAGGGAAGKKISPAVGGMLVLSICGIGYLAYDALSTPEAVTPAAPHAQPKSQPVIQDVLAKPKAKPEKPWPKLPRATAFLAECATQLGAIRSSVGGWTISEATCSQGSIAATYKRQGVSTVADFQQSAQALGMRVRVNGSGSEGVYTEDYQGLPGADEPLIDTDPARTAIVSHFQALDVPVTLTEAANPVDDKTEAAPWNTFVFQIDTALTPIPTSDHPNQLLSADLPGLRITSVKFSRTDAPPFLSWTVNGSLYAK